MSETRPDPGPIMQLATGFWDSATLLAANELNLFGALAEGALTAAEVAARLQCGIRAIVMLLDACVGLGLLTKDSDTSQSVYANMPASAAFLVPGRPGYLGNAIRWSAAQYAAWGQLTHAVRTDSPVSPPSRHLGEDPEQTRTFVMGMHNRALGTARGVLPFLDFSGTTELLDIGGGPGTYAMLLARQYPHLQVTTLDLPEVVKIADELITQANLGDRVRTRAGNAVTDDYGESAYDGVLFSGVLHQMAPETIRTMLAKAARALRPGGRIIVSDIMLNDTKTQPLFAALFSLQMLLTSESGAVFSADECRTWMEAAGFSQVSVRPLLPPLPYTVLCGEK